MSKLPPKNFIAENLIKRPGILIITLKSLSHKIGMNQICAILE